MNHSDIKLTPLLDTIQFVEMTDEEYFSPKYSEYISNSRLALINPLQDGSPERYLEGLGKNQQFSDSLTFGSAVHEQVLQPNDFIVVDTVNRPTAKLGAMADELYKVYKSNGKVTPEDTINASNIVGYYKDKMNDNRIERVLADCEYYWETRKEWEESNSEESKVPIYLDARSREKLQKCLTSVSNNKEIQSLLHPEPLITDPVSLNEAALFIDVLAEYNGKKTILKLKGKLDNFTIDFDLGAVVLNDLKTTGHYLPDFAMSFEKYRYFRQMAMYIWMLKLYVLKKYAMQITSLSANMLLISTIPNYDAGVFKVSKHEIHKGFSEFSDLLKRVAKLKLEQDEE